ncbi:MAG: hypothetical protein HOD87_04670 [Gammaproteobacteria bacterium]|nr:hypothetical protein [Gammaproteobacteria bacterium]
MIGKRYILGISLLAALLLSQTASADSRSHRRGYDSYGYGGYSNRNYSRNYSRRANPYHYGRSGRRNSSYVNSSYGYGGYYSPYRSRYRDRHFDAGNFLGGIVVGSLLSTPRYSYRRPERVVYRSAPVVREREVIYAPQSSSTGPAPIASGRRLLRDLEGNCFERVIDEEGNEVRVQLEAQECNF